MKTTTTLNEIIQSELIKLGENEFFNNDQLTSRNDEFAFIRKIMRYDDDVHEIVTRSFFGGLSIGRHDKEFKKLWINRFAGRQIGTQTVEQFANKVISVTITHEVMLDILFEDYAKFLTGGSDSMATNIQDSRNATATLPQTEVNIDVDNTILNYADGNVISRNKGTTANSSNKYDPNAIAQMMEVYDNILKKYEKRCFLNVW